MAHGMTAKTVAGGAQKMQVGTVMSSPCLSLRAHATLARPVISLSSVLSVRKILIVQQRIQVTA